MTPLIYKIENKILPILKDECVLRSSIFGSFARGENNSESDVDILVELGKPTGFFGFVRLQRKLEETLGRKVDLLTYKSIYPPLKKYIEEDEVLIYGERP